MPHGLTHLAPHPGAPGDGAALLFLPREITEAPLRVQPGPRGGLMLHARASATKFSCHADVIAELLEESAELILENAGAGDGVFHWNLDTDSMVLSTAACDLLGLRDTGEVLKSRKALEFLSGEDRALLLLSVIRAATSGHVADVYFIRDDALGSVRLRFVARRVEGTRRVLEGVIRLAGRI